MYYYDFQIAGLLLRVESQFALMERFELADFEAEYCPDAHPDVVYTLQALPTDWQIRGTQLVEDRLNAIYDYDGEEHRYYFWNVHSKDQYVLVRHRKTNPKRFFIEIQSAYLELIWPQFRLAAFLSMERILPNFNGLILHAALINWRGNGILFTAPSGTGKSTQADLWHRLESAEILNGDRAIIRRQDGEFLAYGSPYAGTSGLHMNRSVPIKAIVVLSQAKENALRPLTPASAFQKILRETSALLWDTQLMANLTDLLVDLVGQVNVFHLACLPNADAVDILKQAMTS